jgi:DNA replication initiation complex subunit (GINS family)
LRGEEETIQVLKRLLDSEEQSEHLTKIPADTYTRIATYVGKLRKSGDANGDDLLSRLTKKQLSLLEGMGRQLLDRRMEKASRGPDLRDLLPEEKFVCEFYTEYERMRDRFVKALMNGQQSTFTILQKNQMGKRVTVRFQRPLGEVIGFDLTKYGPFKVHDVAEIPAANAEVLVSNGDAVMVYTRDSI